MTTSRDGKYNPFNECGNLKWKGMKLFPEGVALHGGGILILQITTGFVHLDVFLRE